MHNIYSSLKKGYQMYGIQTESELNPKSLFGKLRSDLGSDLESDLNIFNSESDSDDISDIKMEITEYSPNNDNHPIKTYSISSSSLIPNRKRLLCFSLIKGEECIYGSTCTFAHNLDEQMINFEKQYIYQIILDKNLMNFFSITNPKTENIYRDLLFFTHLCSKCTNGICMGGYNCKYGSNMPSTKICKNDLLTGECINKSININVNENVLNKIGEITQPDEYIGCINGHHLSTRGLMPFYTYINKRYASEKTTYQSVRYIDMSNINKTFSCPKNSQWKFKNPDGSSESTDDEINGWFKNVGFDNESNSDSDSSSDSDSKSNSDAKSHLDTDMK